MLSSKHCFSLHKDTTPLQPNHTVTPTHIKPEQYNTWNKSTISCKLLKTAVLTFETCWAVNSEIIKQVTSSWSIFIQLVKMVVHGTAQPIVQLSYKLNDQWILLWLLAEIRDIFSSHYPASKVNKIYFVRGVEQLALEAGHPLESKNECSYTSLPPYFLIAWELLKYRENFPCIFTIKAHLTTVGKGQQFKYT